MDANNTAQTLTLVLGWLRELSIIGFILALAWHARGAYDDAKNFFERISTHMETMETFAKSVVENHLTHMEESLKKLADNMPVKEE